MKCISSYALKTSSYPQYHSAFTYNDDKFVSQIDYGKNIYEDRSQ